MEEPHCLLLLICVRVQYAFTGVVWAMNKVFPRIFSSPMGIFSSPMEGILGINWEQRYLALEQRCRALEQRCAELLAENQVLREQLNTTSNNSSKPPSQDPNRKNRHSESTGRKPGGQPGHAGHKRTLYPPEKVSKTIEVRPEICPGCTSWAFERTPVAVEIRQVIDLPEISPEITQYNIYT